MTDILEQLREESLRLARGSFDSVDCGLAANIADAAIDEIERLRGLIPTVAQPEQQTPGAAVLKHAGELHDLGFNAGWNGAIEAAALAAEGFDAACDSPRMKLFVEAGLVMAIYKRDGEIGQAIRALAAQPPAAPVGMDWKLSDEAKQQIAEIDRNIREAPANIARHNGLSADNVQEITSIVSRLRNFAVWNARHSHYDPVPLCKEAADLIERLTAVPQAARESGK